MFFNILCISSSVSRSSPPLVTDSVASPIGNDNDGIPGDELKLTAKPSLPLTHPKHNLFLFVCCKAHSPFRPVNMSAFMPHALHTCIYGHRHPNLRKALGHIVTVHGQPLVFPLGFYLVTSELGILPTRFVSKIVLFYPLCGPPVHECSRFRVVECPREALTGAFLSSLLLTPPFFLSLP